MTLAAINWLSISINLLLVVFVIVCLLMILLVLMQRPKQEGLGAAFGGGVTDQVFGARTSNVLQRATVYMASLFFIIALALAVLIGKKNQKIKTLADKTPAAKVEAPKPVIPVVPVQPKSLSEELPAPDAPAPEVAPEPAPAPVPAPEVTPAPEPTPETAPVPEPEVAPETAPETAPESEDKPAQP